MFKLIEQHQCQQYRLADIAKSLDYQASENSGTSVMLEPGGKNVGVLILSQSS